MRLVYVSNSCEHVVRPLCDGLYKTYGDDFVFIETQRLDESRAQIGSRVERPYIFNAFGKEEEARRMCTEADAVIFGSADIYYIEERIKNDKLTLYYSERMFKKGYWRYFNPITMSRVRRRYIVPSKNKNFHLLCASSYAALDFHRVGAFRNKMYKWGYQIEVHEKDIDTLMKSKPQDGLSIIWVGRLVDVKRCDSALRTIRRIKDAGYEPRLTVIGTGDLDEELKALARELKIENNVLFKGACKIEETREEMDRANIFLFTSNFGEGWGATLNECMASGCACVASHGAGSTFFLTNDGTDALVYKCDDEKMLYEKTHALIKDKELRERVGKNAYKKMYELWNPQKSYIRMVKLLEDLMSTGNSTSFSDGPCSKSEIIKENWYR